MPEPRDFEYEGFNTAIRDKGKLDPISLPFPLGLLNPVVNAVTDRIPVGGGETLTDKRGYEEALSVRANAEQARTMVNRDMLRGGDASKSLATYLEALEQRTSPEYAGKVLQELQSYSPALSRDVGANPQFRDQYQQRFMAARGQTPGIQQTQGTGQTPVTQQLNSNTPGQQRGGAIPGTRSPQSLAAQAPGSGVTPEQPQDPNRAAVLYRSGLERDITKAGAEQQQAVVQQGQASNQQAILAAVEAANRAGLAVPPEWQAIAEGRPISAETTQTQLDEAQRGRNFTAQQDRFNEPLVPVASPDGSVYERRSQAAGQQVGSAAVVPAGDRVRARNLAEQRDSVNRMNATIGMIRERIANPGSVAGAAGATKSFVQRAAGTAKELAGLVGTMGLQLEPESQEYLAQLQSEASSRDADQTGLLLKLLAFQAAGAIANQQGRGLSDADRKAFEDVVGAGRVVADEADLVSRLDTLSNIVKVYGVATDQPAPSQSAAPSPAPTAAPAPTSSGPRFTDPAAAERIRQQFQSGQISQEQAREALSKLKADQEEQRERSRASGR